MSEMVMRVARAISEADHMADGDYRKLARAAIEAMREPTDEMLVAMEMAAPELSTFATREESPSFVAYRAAIDATSGEGAA